MKVLERENNVFEFELTDEEVQMLLEYAINDILMKHCEEVSIDE